MTEYELPFTEEWQEAIIGNCIVNAKFFMKCYGKLKPGWFTKNLKLGTLYDQLCKSYELYGQFIKSVADFKNETFFLEQKRSEQEAYYQLIDRCAKLSVDLVGIDKLERNLTGFLRVSMFKESIEGASRIYRSDGYEDAFNWTTDQLKKIQNATLVDDNLIMSFDNPDTWIAEHEVRKGAAISTGNELLDSALGGGLFKKEACAFMAPANVGKCLGKDTPVLMYDGTIKKVQDVLLGDQLMGPDSKPRNVLNVTRGRSKLYKISPSVGGMEWVCNDVHVLSLKVTQNRYNYKKGAVVNIPINEYVNKSNNFKQMTGLWRSSVEFVEKKDLPIDPYILGLWLGDGSSAEASLTSVDDEIIKEWTAYAKKQGLLVTRCCKKNAKHVGTYRISTKTNLGNKNRNILKILLKKMNVLNNKHIPHEYLTSSTEQRMQLLAGLIDTDGYILSHTNGGVEIMAKSNKLSDNIVYLGRSLGFKVSCNRTIKTIKSINFSGEYNRILIFGNIEEIPLRLSRKRKKMRNAHKNSLTTHFDIQDIGIGDYYGFELDGDHLFLLGDFTVTHNTTAMITLARHAVWNRNKVLFLIHEGFPEEIRLRFIASFLGVSTNTIYRWRQDPQMRQWLMFAAGVIKNRLTFVPYIRTNAMYVEDVIEKIIKLNMEEKMRTGTGYDLIIDDYPKKLKSRTRTNTREGLYRVEVAEVYENFNHLAAELDAHTFVAIQTNRQGLKQNNDRVETDFLLGMEEMDESFGIAQNIPNIITLNRSPYDKKKNIMRMNVTRSRNSQTDIVVNTRTDYACCLAFGDKKMFEHDGMWHNELDNGFLPSYLQSDNSKPKTELVDQTLLSQIGLNPNVEGIGVAVPGAAKVENNENS